ncbi:MHC class II transactivator [Tiliqua scincoides]|uniref:MHC class II transactivator n=1 Tax=Tiliqua scincoides TaxID=71010 RepID=UPI003462BA97
MDLFTEILPSVREILGHASASQVEVLLNLLVEEGAISREYCHTLLQEGDRDDLARKISLHLVETWAEHLNTGRPLHCPQDCGSPPDDAPSDMPARSRGLSDSMMDPGIPPGKSYLDLLCSDVDPFLLCKQIEEEDEFLPAQPADLFSCDPENNSDVFYTMESDDSGEELLLCSNTGEAYDKIAALDHYVFRDQESVEDIFGRFISDETTAEYPGGCTEVKKRSSSSDAPETKRRKVAHSPAVYIVNGNSVAVPLNNSPSGAVSQSNFHVQFCMTTRGPVGRDPKAFGPSGTPNLAYFPLGTKDIQVIVIVEPVPQLVNLPVGPGAADISPCPGEAGMDKGPEIPPVSPEQVHNRSDPVSAARKQLKKYFQESCRLMPTEQEIPLERLYIDADLAQCPAESRSGRSAELRVSDLDQKEKVRVARSQLFQVAGKPDWGTKVIMVLGKAGMGKSLLAQKVCLDWSNGILTEYDFVFRFDCLKLSQLLEEPCGLQRLLLELSDGPPEAGDDVYRYVLRHPDKVLLIFDGLEELRDQDSLLPGSDSPSRRELVGLGEVLAGLFQKKLLSGCTLLLMAHPKDKFHPYMPKTDKVLELLGFSTQQAESYLTRYFEGSPSAAELVTTIKSHLYLFSHCSNPGLCRFVCEFMSETGNQELPSTLTGLFVKFLLRKLGYVTNSVASPSHLGVIALAEVAWSFSQTHQGVLLHHHFPSLEAQELAVQAGIVRPFRFPPGSRTEHGYTFSSLAVQNFLVALHLVLAKEIKDKKLTKHLQLLSKKPPSPFWDLVPRFLAGLLFLQDELSSPTLLGEDAETMIAKKQRSVSRYIRKLEIGDFGPKKLLELSHCVHETQDKYLLQHLALALKPSLSFCSVQLTLPDVHVLCSVLSRSAKRFALDLRQSVDLEGLRMLVSLKDVASFRVSLGEAVRLWNHFWEARQGEQLKSAIEKFAVVPFKAKTMKDIDDLVALVRMQEEVAQGKADSTGCTIRVIPAVTDLRQLDFSLGPVCGLKGFCKLVGILDAFLNLRHLDLDAQNENEIGDEGVSGLCDVLPRLPCLEVLNLSQNKITDRGAKKLAKALPLRPSLKTLSLYNNYIGDGGAESIAEALPQMTSLRVLHMHCNNKITAAGAQHLINSLQKCPWVQTVALWNSTIPYGVLKHLQQLDSRIRLF